MVATVGVLLAFAMVALLLDLLVGWLHDRP